jgi:hypothetical protein
LNEITDLRRRIREADRGFAPDSIETELKGTRQRLQYLLTLSPAIIYTTKASGDFGCTFVSENLGAIMGYTPPPSSERVPTFARLRRYDVC